MSWRLITATLASGRRSIACADQSRVADQPLLGKAGPARRRRCRTAGPARRPRIEELLGIDRRALVHGRVLEAPRTGSRYLGAARGVSPRRRGCGDRRSSERALRSGRSLHYADIEVWITSSRQRHSRRRSAPPAASPRWGTSAQARRRRPPRARARRGPARPLPGPERFPPGDFTYVGISSLRSAWKLTQGFPRRSTITRSTDSQAGQRQPHRVRGGRS